MRSALLIDVEKCETVCVHPSKRMMMDAYALRESANGVEHT